MAYLKTTKDQDAQSLLASVTAPVLLIWGGKNPAMKTDVSDIYEKYLVNTRSTKLIYADVDHKIEREAPNELEQDVQSFLIAQLLSTTSNSK